MQVTWGQKSWEDQLNVTRSLYGDDDVIIKTDHVIEEFGLFIWCSYNLKSSQII